MTMHNMTMHNDASLRPVLLAHQRWLRAWRDGGWVCDDCATDEEVNRG